jgi:hypothetical protein
MTARIRKGFVEGLGAFALLALMAGLAGYLVVGGEHADAAKAEIRPTTASAADAAGATIIPTQPKLAVEPK